MQPAVFCAIFQGGKPSRNVMYGLANFNGDGAKRGYTDAPSHSMYDWEVDPKQCSLQSSEAEMSLTLEMRLSISPCEAWSGVISLIKAYILFYITEQTIRHTSTSKISTIIYFQRCLSKDCCLYIQSL